MNNGTGTGLHCDSPQPTNSSHHLSAAVRPLSVSPPDQYVYDFTHFEPSLPRDAADSIFTIHPACQQHVEQQQRQERQRQGQQGRSHDGSQGQGGGQGHGGQHPVAAQLAALVPSAFRAYDRECSAQASARAQAVPVRHYLQAYNSTVPGTGILLVLQASFCKLERICRSMMDFARSNCRLVGRGCGYPRHHAASHDQLTAVLSARLCFTTLCEHACAAPDSTQSCRDHAPRTAQLGREPVANPSVCSRACLTECMLVPPQASTPTRCGRTPTAVATRTGRTSSRGWSALGPRWSGYRWVGGWGGGWGEIPK